MKNIFANKKVIIFDMDGTLIDSVRIWNAVDVDLIYKLAQIYLPEEEVQQRRDARLHEYSKAENPYMEYCKYLGKTYRSPLTPEEIHSLRYDIATDFLIYKVSYKPNVANLLHTLKERGFRLWTFMIAMPMVIGMKSRNLPHII